MRSFIKLTRAEPHLQDQIIVIQSRQIDTMSPNILDKDQTLMRVNGKEFIVKEPLEQIYDKLGLES